MNCVGDLIRTVVKHDSGNGFWKVLVFQVYTNNIIDKGEGGVVGEEGVLPMFIGPFG